MNDLQFITAIEGSIGFIGLKLKKGENYNTVLRAAPIEVAELLNKYLFAVKRQSFDFSHPEVSDSFNHFIERVGLSLAEADKNRAAPFDPLVYEKQACCIPRLPNPMW